MSQKAFQVYSASAGAGKTFSLVREFLLLCLRSDEPTTYSRILAITFTIKAAAEMKKRVLDALDAFRKDEVPAKHRDLFIAVRQELDIDDSTLRLRARQTLKSLLHDYGSLSISTIDKFTYRLVRTFSHDLGLSTNFDVELDTDDMYRQTVELLLDKTGSEDELSGYLRRFVERKMDDGKSWNVEFDLVKMATHLGVETSIEALELLRNIPLSSFKEIRSSLEKKRREVELVFHRLADEGEAILAPLPEKAISNGSVNGYVKKVRKADPSALIDWGTRLQGQVDEQVFYAKSAPAATKSATENATPQILDWLFRVRTAAVDEGADLQLIDLVLRDFDAMAVLHEIERVYLEYKETNNIESLATFNQLIHKSLLELPVPYIYERIGERYRHYFVDEFQDTSVLQWENLTPLIHNAISSGGTSMIVGDAKQSIYRWRGGEAEQFMALIDQAKNPSEKGGDVAYALTHVPLEYNFRSGTTVVEFNNDLFRFIAETINHSAYSELYAQGDQKPRGFEGGYVEVSWIDHDREDYNDINVARSVERVKALLSEGYEPRDIALLVRRNISGEWLVNALSTEGIPVVSTDSLRLGNSVSARTLTSALRLIQFPENMEARVDFVEAYSQSIAWKPSPEEWHSAFTAASSRDSADWNNWVNQMKLQVLTNQHPVAGLYEWGEQLARGLGLMSATADPFLQFTLDSLHVFGQNKSQNITDFLEWWDDKGHKESISAPSTMNAVQVMTIHKAKGLEFPVVLFPFADWTVDSDRSPKRWLKLNSEEMGGLPVAQVSMNGKAYPVLREKYPEYGTLYEDYLAQVRFDNVNLLYVAATRAVERLYIFTTQRTSKTSEYKYLNEYLNRFVESCEKTPDYEVPAGFGTIEAPRSPSKSNGENSTEPFDTFVSESWRNRVKLSPQTEGISDELSEQPRRWGNTVHALLAEVERESDIPQAVDKAIRKGRISKQHRDSLIELLSEVVTHPELSEAFNADLVYNEREWVGSQSVDRPDRICQSGDTWWVIDYKTGAEEGKHHKQLQRYVDLLKVDGPIKARLVYIEAKKIRVVPMTQGHGEQLSLL